MEKNTTGQEKIKQFFEAQIKIAKETTEKLRDGTLDIKRMLKVEALTDISNFSIINDSLCVVPFSTDDGGTGYFFRLLYDGFSLYFNSLDFENSNLAEFKYMEYLQMLSVYGKTEVKH